MKPVSSTIGRPLTSTGAASAAARTSASSDTSARSTRSIVRGDAGSDTGVQPAHGGKLTRPTGPAGSVTSASAVSYAASGCAKTRVVPETAQAPAATVAMRALAPADGLRTAAPSTASLGFTSRSIAPQPGVPGRSVSAILDPSMTGIPRVIPVPRCDQRGKLLVAQVLRHRRHRASVMHPLDPHPQVPPQELRRPQYRTRVVALLLPTALKRLPDRGDDVLLSHLGALSEPRLLSCNRRLNRRASQQVVRRFLGTPGAISGSPRSRSSVEVHDVFRDEPLLSRSQVMIGEVIHAPDDTV